MPVIPPRRRECLSALLVLAAASLTHAAVPILPTIPAGVYNVTNYAAVGDGVATNTSAIQAAINAAGTSAARGGTVEIPAGTFLSGPLVLTNGINLQLDAGATLQMLPLSKYPGGVVSPSDFITGSKLHDLEISGTGTIEGQGSAWWPYANTNNANRPVMVTLSACTRVLIQDATFQNSPMQHFSIKGKGGHVTMQRVNILAPSSSDPFNPSHNTDAMDLAETNCLVQNCNISVGDDNVALGSSASTTADIVITNCAFGDGHGISLGSHTEDGVSNVIVINCTFNGTDNGIRMKSDNDRGGVSQNLSYLNLGMTNVDFPIVIYSYYNTFGTPNNITPQLAAAMPVPAATNTTPLWRNILISNVTATASRGAIAGIIWGRTERPATNITLARVSITASKPFDIYNAYGIRWIDSQVNVPAGSNTFTVFKAGVVLTNSSPGGAAVSVGGLSSGNSLACYNAPVGLNAADLLGFNPLTLSGSVLADGTDITLPGSTVLNFGLGLNHSALATTGNLTLNSTLNFVDGGGLGAGTYTVCSYGGSLSGNPVLGSVPFGYSFSLDTSTPDQVNVTVVPKPVNAWGDDYFGQCDVSPALTNAVAVAAGDYHSLALRPDGTVSAWGDDYNGQCDVPAGLSNVVAIAAGAYHSLALRANGTVVAWGDNSSGQINVPAQAINIVAISAGGWHNLALRADGTVVAWGDGSSGQTSVPSQATNVVAVAAGGAHSLALRGDGTLLGWGSNLGPFGNSAGQAVVPLTLSRVVAIAAGDFHSLALRDNGTVVAWGDNSWGQTSVPSGLNNVIAIAAGGAQSLAVQPGGSVLGWGDNSAGQTSLVPAPAGVTAIAAGGYHTLTLVGQNPPAPLLVAPACHHNTFSVSVPTLLGRAYFLQSKDAPTNVVWSFVTGLAGNGGMRSLSDTAATATQRLYRVRQQ